MSLGARGAPVTGIFAVEVEGIVGGRRWPGAASVGVRPTVQGGAQICRPLLEVHLLDFEGDLYGRRVGVDFLHRIRDEKKFDSLDLLRKAIENDIHETREWFAARAARA
jgi:riboflavin kinase/FMN adenylyltransferase